VALTAVMPTAPAAADPIFQVASTDMVLVELSADSQDVEASGANLPILLVMGVLDAHATVVVTDTTTGTATAGTDYSFASPQTVIIPAGTYDGTAATAIAIPTLAIIDDSDGEPDETIVLELTVTPSPVSGDGLVLGDANDDEQTTSTVTYTIVDDDAATTTTTTTTVDGAVSPNVETTRLAFTGASSTRLLGLGALLLAAGAAVEVTRRRLAKR